MDFAAGPYGVFKAALIHYAKGLSYQLAGKNIRVNALSPGNTYFPGGVWEKIEHGNPDLFKQAMALNPTGRMGKPGGNGARRCLPGQPGGQFHYRDEPGGGRGADARRAVLGSELIKFSIWRRERRRYYGVQYEFISSVIRLGCANLLHGASG